MFGIRPIWYKSHDLERIKDVYRGSTVVIYTLPSGKTVTKGGI